MTTFDLSLVLRTGRAAASTDRLEKSAARAGRTFDGAQKSADRAGRTTRLYGTAADRASRSARTAASNTARFSTASDRAGRVLGVVSRRLVAFAAGLAIVAAGLLSVGQAVNVFSQFEDRMAAVQAVTSAARTDMVALTSVASQLGETTRFSAAEAAAGMQFLGQAGFQVTQIVGAMPAVLNLAAAAALDLGRSADITSNIMSAFAVPTSEVGRIADALAASASNANTNVEQMGEAMKFVGPVAAALDISMEDAAAAIGVLSNAGLQASVAGTGLRRILSELASPSKAASDALARLGVKVDEVNPKNRSLTEIVQRLAAANLEASDAFDIFGDRGAPAILALTSQAADLERLTSVVNNSGGAAERMAGIMEDTLAGAGRELRSMIESLRIAIGEQLAPVLVDAADRLRAFLKDNRDGALAFGRAMARGLSAVIEVIAFLSRHLDKVITLLVGLGAAFAALKLAAAIAALVAYVKGVTALEIALYGAGLSVNALQVAVARLTAFLAANPFVLVAAAIGLLAGAIYQGVQATREAEAATAAYYDELRFGSGDIADTTRAHQALADTLRDEVTARRLLAVEMDTAQQRLAALQPVLDSMGEALRAGDSEGFERARLAAQALGVTMAGISDARSFERVGEEVEALERQVADSEAGIGASLRETESAERSLAETVEDVVNAEVRLRDQQLGKMLDLERQARQTREALRQMLAAGGEGEEFFAELDALKSGLSDLQERAARAREEIEATGSRIDQVYGEASKRVAELFRQGEFDRAASILRAYFPEGEVELIVAEQKGLSEAWQRWVEAQEEADRKNREREQATEDQLKQFAKLREQYIGQAQDARQLTAAYAEGEDAVRRALDRISIEGRLRGDAADLTMAQRDALRELLVELTEEERLAAGSQMIDALGRQLVAQQAINAAYSEGEAKVVEVRAEQELLARVASESADASATQLARITELLRELKEAEAVERFEQARSNLDAEVDAAERLAAAHRLGAAEVQRVTVELDQEAQKRSLLAGLTAAQRLELEPLIDRLIAYRGEVERLAGVQGLAAQVAQTQALIAAWREGRSAVEAMTVAQRVYQQIIDQNALGNAELADQITGLVLEQHQLDQALSETQRRAEIARETFRNFLEGFQSNFASTIRSALDEGFDSFEDFFAGLTSLFKDMLAEWVAQVATTKFAASLGVDGGGGGAGAEFGLAVKKAVADLIAGAKTAAAALSSGGGVASTELGAGGGLAATELGAGGGVANAELAAGGGIANAEISAGATAGGAELIRAATIAGQRLNSGTGGISGTGGAGGTGSLFSSASGSGFWASGFGAAAIGAAVLVAYAVWSDKQREKEFQVGPSFGVSGGVRSREAFGQQHAMVDAWEDTLDAIEKLTGGLVKDLPEIALKIRRDGEQVRVYLEGALLGSFKSIEEALNAGLLAGLRGASLEGVAQEIEQVLRAPVQSIDELMEALTLVQGQLDFDLSPLQRSMKEFLASQEEVAARFRELGVSTGIVWDNTITGLKRFRDELLGIERDEHEQRLRDAEFYNERLADLESDLRQRLTEATRQLTTALDAQARMAAAGANELPQLTARWNQLIAQIPTLTAEIADLERQLGQLPGAIDPTEVPSGGGGGGGNRQERRERLRETLTDIERSGLPEFERQLLELNDQFAELAEEARALGEPLERVAAARRIELEALQEQLVIEPLSEFLEGWNLSEFERQAASIGDRFDKIREANEALAEQESELFVARWKINIAERRALEQIAEQVVSGLGLPMEEARASVERWRDAIDFLRQQMADGVISAERFGEVIAQSMQMATAELFTLTASIFDQMGATQQAADFRARLEQANFHLQVAQLNFLYQQYLGLGLLSEEVAAILADALGFINDPANWPTFDPAPASPAPTPQPPAVQAGPGESDVDAVRERLEEQIEAWNRLPLGDVTRDAMELTDQLDELRTAAIEAGLPVGELERAFRTAVSVFVDDILGPFEDLDLSPLERELRDLEDHFADIRAAFEEIGATTQDWERLAAAQDAAFADFWRRATDPLRDLLEEMRQTDPRVSSQDAFNQAQSNFRDLAARARAGDLSALEELERAGRTLLAQSESFLGGGVGSLAVRDEIMQTLSELTGEPLDPDAVADPVVDEVKQGNVILADIRELLGGERRRPDAAPIGNAGVRLARLPAGANIDYAVGARERSFERLPAHVADRERLGGDLLMAARAAAAEQRRDRSDERASIEALARELALERRRAARERDSDRNRERNTTNAHLAQRGDLLSLTSELVAQNREVLRRQHQDRKPAGGIGK